MSPIVLVDVPSISLSLVGSFTPQSVQLVITGVTAGQSLHVTGDAAGHAWTVRGGAGAVGSAQVILVDAATPLNVPITYTVTVEGQPFTAAPITVPFGSEYVLQSLDGRTVVPFEWHGADDSRDIHLRSVLFDVPGRSHPLARWDTAGGETVALPIRTTPAATAALLAQLRTAGPVMLLRTDGSIYDIPAVQYLIITRAPRALFGFDGLRLWTLTYEVIDDPEPDAILATSTWDDFDVAYAASTWDDFDAEWAGSTWDDFDRTDWTQYA